MRFTPFSSVWGGRKGLGELNLEIEKNGEKSIKVRLANQDLDQSHLYGSDIQAVVPNK